MKGVYAMMKELQDLAGQHDHIAESLSKTVVKDLQTAVQEVKQERRRVSNDVDDGLRLILPIPILLMCSATNTDTRNYLMTMVDDWYKGVFVGVHVVHMHWVMY